MTPDVNVLVAASRSDHPHHAVARLWLERALVEAGEGAPFSLQPMVVASFLRLVTNPRIFVQPTPISDALQFIDALMDAPGVVQAQLGSEWPLLRKLCQNFALTGNAVPDAWLAAAVVQQHEHLVSFDGDFRRLLPISRFTRLAA
jgi:toxin-antitoxin system PIN domain toxin